MNGLSIMETPFGAILIFIAFIFLVWLGLAGLGLGVIRLIRRRFPSPPPGPAHPTPYASTTFSMPAPPPDPIFGAEFARLAETSRARDRRLIRQHFGTLTSNSRIAWDTRTWADPSAYQTIQELKDKLWRLRPPAPPPMPGAVALRTRADLPRWLVHPKGGDAL